MIDIDRQKFVLHLNLIQKKKIKKHNRLCVSAFRIHRMKYPNATVLIGIIKQKQRSDKANHNKTRKHRYMVSFVISKILTTK